MSGNDEVGAKRRAESVLDILPTKRASSLSPQIAQRYGDLFARFDQQPAIKMILQRKQPAVVVGCYDRACGWYLGPNRERRIVPVLLNMLSVYNSKVFAGHLRLSALQVVDFLQTLQSTAVAKCPLVSATDRFTHFEAEALQEVYPDMPDDVAVHLSSKHEDSSAAIVQVTEMIAALQEDKREGALIVDIQAASTPTLQANDSRLSFEVVVFVMMFTNFVSEHSIAYINRYMNPERQIEFGDLLEILQRRMPTAPEKLPDVAQDKRAGKMQQHMETLHADDLENLVMPAMLVSDAEKFAATFMETALQNLQHLEDAMPADWLPISEKIVEMALGMLTDQHLPADLVRVTVYKEAATSQKCLRAISVVGKELVLRTQDAIEKLYDAKFDIKLVLTPASVEYDTKVYDTPGGLVHRRSDKESQ